MSNAFPTRLSGVGIDLSPRFTFSETVAASPAAGTETIIATITIPQPVLVNSGIVLVGFAAFTVGTDAVSANLKIRQTDASGSTIKATGATTVVATNLRSLTVVGVDESPTLPGQVYVLTLLMGSGSAESTVSAATLAALVV